MEFNLLTKKLHLNADIEFMYAHMMYTAKEVLMRDLCLWQNYPNALNGAAALNYHQTKLVKLECMIYREEEA